MARTTSKPEISSNREGLRCLKPSSDSPPSLQLSDHLQFSDQHLARAERDDLEECARILGVQCAHYQSKFGKLPMSETMDVLNSETMNDEQATWIADGFEMVVAVLGVLEQEHPKH